MSQKFELAAESIKCSNWGLTFPPAQFSYFKFGPMTSPWQTTCLLYL